MRRAAALVLPFALAAAATVAVAQLAAIEARESAAGLQLHSGAGGGALFVLVNPTGGAEVWALSAEIDVRLEVTGPDGYVLENDDHGRGGTAFAGARPTDAVVVLPRETNGVWRVLVWTDDPRGGGAALVARGVRDVAFEGRTDPPYARGVDGARSEAAMSGVARQKSGPSAAEPLGAARRVVIGAVDDFSALGQAAGREADQLPPLRPWEPPAPSRRGVVDRSKLLAALARTSGEAAPTLGAAADFLQRSLVEAGYHELGFLGVPGGFAIVTQIEQIDAAGAPLLGAERYAHAIHWDPIPFWRVWDLFAALFESPRGVYRVIALIVSDAEVAPGEPAGAETFERWAREGRVSLPPDLRGRPFGARHDIVVHVYEFSKVEHDGPVRFESRSALGVDSHLRHTRLASLL